MELLRPVDGPPAPRQPGISDGKHRFARIVAAPVAHQLLPLEVTVEKTQRVHVDPASGVGDQTELLPGRIEQAADAFQELPLLDHAALNLAVHRELRHRAAGFAVQRIAVAPRHRKAVAHQAADAGFRNKLPVVVELQVPLRPPFAGGKAVLPLPEVVTPRRLQSEVFPELPHRRSILLQSLAAIEGQLLAFGGQIPDLFSDLVDFGEVGITVPAAPPLPLPCDPAAHRAGRIRFGRRRLQKETENLLVLPQLPCPIRQIEFQEIAVFVLHHLDLTAQVCGAERIAVEGECQSLLLIADPKIGGTVAVTGSGQLSGPLDGSARQQEFHDLPVQRQQYREPVDFLQLFAGQ